SSLSFVALKQHLVFFFLKWILFAATAKFQAVRSMRAREQKHPEGVDLLISSVIETQEQLFAVVWMQVDVIMASAMPLRDIKAIESGMNPIKRNRVSLIPPNTTKHEQACIAPAQKRIPVRVVGIPEISTLVFF